MSIYDVFMNIVGPRIVSVYGETSVARAISPRFVAGREALGRGETETAAALAQVLSNYGQRVQKSVFECDLDDRQYLQMRKEIDKLVDQEEDSEGTSCAGAAGATWR